MHSFKDYAASDFKEKEAEENNGKFVYLFILINELYSHNQQVSHAFIIKPEKCNYIFFH